MSPFGSYRDRQASTTSERRDVEAATSGVYMEPAAQILRPPFVPYIRGARRSPATRHAMAAAGFNMQAISERIAAEGTGPAMRAAQLAQELEGERLATRDDWAAIAA